MEENDLEYEQLSPSLGDIQRVTGLPESAAFLYWFLVNVYRLDETTARDALCDHTNDKGIDGIYVDHNEKEIHFFQVKVSQNPRSTIGDVQPKNANASMHQFDSSAKVAAVLESNANEDLKTLLEREKVLTALAMEYLPRSVFVSNSQRDTNSIQYEDITDETTIFDRGDIAARFVDLTPSVGKDSFTFDISYATPLEVEAGSPDARSKMYVFPATALQLVHMEGIGDGSLFQDNVRFSLGNTSVNKSIRASIRDKNTHPNFLLFHNGVTILCSEVDVSVANALTVKNYSVVNGAQSLTSFFDLRSKLTEDLRVQVKVISLRNEELASVITENSNNQNAIKARDMRSNDALMLRLQVEMSEHEPDFYFEIKRGDRLPADKAIISNELAGRIMLAFDLMEPWSAHQVYKVFDERYAQIFGRPAVTAGRIVFLYQLYEVVSRSVETLENRPMASYSLTRYFLLSLLSDILDMSPQASEVKRNPEMFDITVQQSLLMTCDEILKTIVVDLDDELPDDYKSVFKSPNQSEELAKILRAGYQKDARRSRAEPISTWTYRDEDE